LGEMTVAQKARFRVYQFFLSSFFVKRSAGQLK